MPGSVVMKTDGSACLLRALHERDHLAAGAHVGLHEGETAEPGQVDLAVDQRLDGGGV